MSTSSTIRSSSTCRPNIVVKTLSHEPYQEDQWKLIRIGDAVLEFSLPDNRCSIVNINHETSEK